MFEATRQEGDPTWINPDYVMSVSPLRNGQGTYMLTTKGVIVLQEQPEEILKRIRETFE